MILSAGAVGSPQTLMLSGVGDEVHLTEVGVQPVHHLPEVGQNLQDHLNIPMNIDVGENLSYDILSAIRPDPLCNHLQFMSAAYWECYIHHFWSALA